LAQTDTLGLARRAILAPGGLDEQHLDRMLGLVMGHAIDAADLYFQVSHEESWALEDGIVKEGSASIERAWVCAPLPARRPVSPIPTRSSPLRSKRHRARRARSPGSRRARGVQAWQRQAPHSLYLPVDPLTSMEDAAKIEWLTRVDRETRAMDPRIVQVMASMHAVHEIVLVATSDGHLAADVRPLVRFNVSVLAEKDGRREQGYAGAGGRYSLTELMAGDRPIALAREAVRQALVNLEAVPAPAGQMTVVLGPGWPGILLHEAIGHGLEGDFNRKGTSAFSNRVGEKVASESITVVDDGTLAARRGSLNIDDEGTPTQCTTLIENGVLKGYLQDSHNARLMGVKSTGNGRRESFAHMTLPRMTNTYMRAGSHDPGKSSPRWKRASTR
jgi:TldD protein